ncbi:MAG TPA: HAMP domain-containing protein, partial [Ktedonobacteraceae bacterium]
MFREQHIHLKRRIHLPRSLRSLRFRLFMMFLLMVLVTVGVVSWFTDHGTINAVRGYTMNKRVAARNDAITTLMDYNIAAGGHPNQQAEQIMVEQIASTYNIRVVVVDPTGYVIASSDPKLLGRSITPAQMGKETFTSKMTVATAPPLTCKSLVPNTIILSTNATLFCPSPLLAMPVTAPTVSPEQNFLISVNFSILLGTFIAGLIALALAFAFSYTIIKPIKRMTAIARRMEEGDLSQRLTGKTHTEIGELAHALNTMADGLQRSEHLRCNMINDIAHELRTPLTNIRGYLEALQDQVIDPEQEVIAS